MALDNDSDIALGDVGPLVWILREVDSSLDAARSSLRKFVRDQEEQSREGGVADSSSLRTAKSQLHQAVGAVQVVGVPSATVFLQSLETAVERCVQKPELLDAGQLSMLERAMYALREYMQAVAAGRKPQPVKLFAQYALVQNLANAERSHPADLWEYEFEWRDVAISIESQPWSVNLATQFERALLLLLRGKGADAGLSMESSLASAFNGADTRQARSFWAICLGVAQALSHDKLVVDEHVKRAFTRVNLQLKASSSGMHEVSERLARDLLFFCVQAGPADSGTQLHAVRQSFHLERHLYADYSKSFFGAVDPALLKQAQKRVSTVKELWSELSNGDITRSKSLAEAADLVTQSLTDLHPGSQGLGVALAGIVRTSVRDQNFLTAERALEGANALLFLEATFSLSMAGDELFMERASLLKTRLEKVAQGAPAGPLESWMEQLYHNASETQTMGSVVQELKVTLGNIEASLDKYFRDPSDKQSLMQVPSLLGQMRGVMSVLGVDQASLAVAHARRQTEDWLIGTERPPQVQFDQLAQNIGSLSFMIDLLAYQAGMAKSLFVFDTAKGEFRAVMGRTKTRTSADNPQNQPQQLATDIAAVASKLSDGQLSEGTRAELTHKLEEIEIGAGIADASGMRAAASSAIESLRSGSAASAADALRGSVRAPVLAPTQAASIPMPAEEDADSELLEIFLEEARDVVTGGLEQTRHLRNFPSDNESLITVRRAFHTLKGSSRMVGLTDFGEGAWQMEQVFNAWLSQQKPANDALLVLAGDSLNHFSSWVKLIEARTPPVGWTAAIAASAEAFKVNGTYVVITVVAPEPVAVLQAVDAPAEVVGTTADSSVVQLAALDLPQVTTEPAMALAAVSEPAYEAVPELKVDPVVPMVEVPAYNVQIPQPSVAAVVTVPDVATTSTINVVGIDAPLLEALPVLPLEPVLLPPLATLALTPDAPPAIEAVEPDFAFDLSFDDPAPAAKHTVDLALVPVAPVVPVVPAVPVAAATVAASFEPFVFEPLEPVELLVTASPTAAPLTPHSAPTVDEMLDFSLDLGSATDAIPANTGLSFTADEQSNTLSALNSPVFVEATSPAIESSASTANVAPPPAPFDLGFDLAPFTLSTDQAPAVGSFSPQTEAVQPVSAPTSITFTQQPAMVADAALPSFDFSSVAAAATAATALVVTPLVVQASSGSEFDATPTTAATYTAPVQVFEAPAEDVRIIGSLHVPVALYTIFLSEADELVRTLATQLEEWRLELKARVPEGALSAAHTLGGSSGTVGLKSLSNLAYELEGAMLACREHGHQATEPQIATLSAGAEEVKRLLHQFAAGFLKDASPDIGQQVAELRQHWRASFAANAVSVAEVYIDDVIDSRLTDAPLASHDNLPDVAFESTFVAADQPSNRAVEPTELLPIAKQPEQLLVAVSEVEPLVASLESNVQSKVSIEEFAAPALAIAATGAALVASFTAPLPSTASFDADNDHAGVASGSVAVQAVQPIQHPLVSDTASAFSAPVTATRAYARGSALVTESDMDEVDADLFPIFEEEALELFPQLTSALRAWQQAPSDSQQPKQVLRTLHTLKGSSRLAGALRLGDMAHTLESDVENTLRGDTTPAAIRALIDEADEMVMRFDQLRRGEQHSAHEFEFHVSPTLDTTVTHTAAVDVEPASVPVSSAALQETAPQTGSTTTVFEALSTTGLFAAAKPELTHLIKPLSAARIAPVAARANAGVQAVRVRASLLDRLFNQAGEVSLTRVRLETGVTTIRSSLGDLTDNLARLRQQLRDIELQAETQMQTRMAATQGAVDFDPLEFDRFTRFQELTRMMAESVNDVATVQQTLQRTLQSTEDDLLKQARMTRELQRDLLRTRMVEFESLSERLYRVVRQTAKELGKNVRLDIEGGFTEIDRGVLDRMAGSFEHLLRNCVAHGIESPAERSGAGKSDVGQITIALKQEGNEVTLTFADDGAGLNFGKIRQKAINLGLLVEGADLSEQEMSEMIFTSGFTTADAVSEIAGRGIGMDVVKSEILGLGGRVTVVTQGGSGTTFTLVLPLTTAVTQIVLMRTGNMTIGVPASLVEIVQRLRADELRSRFDSGMHAFAGTDVDFFPLATLLQTTASSVIQERSNPMVVVRSAAQRVAIHVDEVLGNQEVVVRNLGPQLSRVPGLAGMSVLASGAVVLIYNPVALAGVYGNDIRREQSDAVQLKAVSAAAAEQLASDAMVKSLAKLQAVEQMSPEEAARHASALQAMAALPPIAAAPRLRLHAERTVMVVDDSLTVRRVTQRFLQRNGFRVVLAKDGLDALEVLQTEHPHIMLLDIEMPRMDGFDLTRNMRADPLLRQIPIVMITSRIADKHKTLAVELGVNHYLGKPYNEEELLSLISRYTEEMAGQIH